MDEKLGGLGHILTTVFLSSFAGFLVRPVMTDVTVAAVCSGLNDSCSLAVYLTGVQQVVITSTYIYVHIGRSLSLFPIFNLQSLPFSG